MTIGTITDACCRAFSVDQIDDRNCREVCDARNAAIFLIRVLLKLKTSSIAGYFRRDHSTVVIVATHTVPNLYECDKEFRGKMDMVLSELGITRQQLINEMDGTAVTVIRTTPIFHASHKEKIKKAFAI